MKKLTLLLFFTITLCSGVTAQNYNNIVNYNFNGTITTGIKITTNLPFTAGSQMPTIIIQGYNYSDKQSIGLVLTYYIYGTPAGFVNHSMSSFGAYTPPVYLSNESGKVVIYIDDKLYYPRFTISAYAQGMSSDVASNYVGWTVSDAALTGSNTVTVPYQNSFSGNVTLPGTGIWNSSGNVGIGTAHPDQALTVKGQVHSTSVVVTSTVPADYVFNADYYLRPLADVKTYVDKNHHLPDVPAATDFKKDGQNLGEMNMLLLRKVEELTLYVIESSKTEKKQQARVDSLQERLEKAEQLSRRQAGQIDTLVNLLKKYKPATKIK